MKVLIILGLIALASSSRSHDKLKCSIKGPKYWCRSEITAKKCDAVSYCNEFVWLKKHKLESPSSDECTYCQQALGTLHMILSNNETQEQVLMGMKAICTQMPEPEREICSSLISLYGKKIIAFVVEHTKDPRPICRFLHLCSADCKRMNDFPMMKNLIKEKISADYCMPCKEYISGLHYMLSSKKAKEEFVNGLKNMCKFLPKEISHLCPFIISGMGEQFVDAFYEYTKDPSQICAATGLCKNRDFSGRHFMMMNKKKAYKEKFDDISISPKTEEIFAGGDKCTTCQQVFGTLHLILSKKETQEQVLMGMEAICALIPEPGREVCSTLIGLFGKKLISFMVEYTKDPRRICRVFHLCSADCQQVTLINLPMMQNLIQKMAFTDYCMPCKEYISGLHYMLSSKKSKEEFVNGLKGMCQFLPKEISHLCPTVVSAFGEHFVDVFYEYIKDPSQICAATGFCKNQDFLWGQRKPDDVIRISKTKERSEYIKFSPESDKKVKTVVRGQKSGATCEVCELVMRYLESILGKNRTEAAIKKGLDKVCTYLPKSVELECVNLVNQYSDQIIHLLIIEFQPSQICKELGLCMSYRKVNNGITCEICSAAMSYLENILGNNRTEEAIKTGLNKLCSHLPRSLRSQCTSFVNQYSDEVLRLLIAELEPSEICEELGLCSSVSKVNDPVTCEICSVAMGYLENILGNNRTEEAIKTGLNKLCSYLPRSLRSQCTSFVNQYSDEVLRLLIAELEPSKICEELGLCSSVSKVNNPVTCEICSVAMGYLENILGNNRTEEAIKTGLNKLCSYLPRSLRSQCTSFVNQYSDEVLRLLIAELEPSKICEELGLCSSFKGDVSAKHLVASTVAQSCELCKYGMNILHLQLNNNDTQVKLKAALTNICSIISSKEIQDECLSLIEDHYDEFIKLLLEETEDPAALCKAVKLCAMPSLKGLILKNGTSCEACIKSLMYIDEFLKLNATKKILHYAVDAICLYIPFFRHQCIDIGDQYLELALKIISEQLKDPRAACKKLHACSDSEAMAVMSVIPSDMCDLCLYDIKRASVLISNKTIEGDIKEELMAICNSFSGFLAQACSGLVASKFDAIIKNISDILKDEHAVCQELHLCTSSKTGIRSTNLPTNAITCGICMDGAKYLGSVFDNNGTKMRLKKAITDLCMYAPQPYGSQCENYIAQYYDFAYAIIIENLEKPELLCEDIGMCKSSAQGRKSMSSNTVSCDVCQLSMGYLDDMLKGSKTKKNVKVALEKLCSELPYTSSECVALVNQYSDKIINLLTNELKETELICKDIGVCSAPEKEVEVKGLAPKNVITCDLCEMIVNKLDSLMDNNHTKENVEKALDAVCERLPKPLILECTYYVDVYAEQIVHILVDQLRKPAELCKELRLCKEKLEKQTVTVKKVMPKNVITCELCKFVFTEVDKLLDNNHTEENVRKALDSVCKRFPSSLRAECTNLVSVYADQIVHLLVDELKKTTELCKELKLCSSTLSKKLMAPKLISNQLASKQDGYIKCLLCRIPIALLFESLKGETSKGEIREALTSICAKLPIGIEQCEVMVKNYTGKVVDLIISGVDQPQLICEVLVYCDLSKANHKAIAVKSNDLIVNPTGCRLCMFIAGKLDGEMVKNSNGKAITKMVKSVCHHARLSTDQLKECQRMVAKYEYLIISLLKKGKLTSFCKKVGTCVLKKEIPNQSTELLKAMSLRNNGLKCMVCEYAVGVLDSVIQEPATERKIINEVHTLCNKLPNKVLLTECNALIGEYGNEMIQMFVENVMQPVEICKDFKVC